MYIDQFCAGFALGDAISHEALLLREHLGKLGFKSRIYSQHFSDSTSRDIHHFKEYKNKKKSILIYHHSFYSDFLLKLPKLKSKIILVYHNTTPTEFVRPYNGLIADQLDQTRQFLIKCSDLFQYNLAASAFNAKELANIGFKDIEIMPVPLLPFENIQSADSSEKMFLDDGQKNILFVGRIFPNKRHQDLIKSFYFYQKIEPKSRLCIVGDFHPYMKGYTAELINLTRALGIEDKVLFTGMVTAKQLHTYYQKSDLFLSMSEHEGFFVPLIECMHMQLPILAYSGSVIPETLGDSGVTFGSKDFPRVAALMHKIIQNKKWQKIIIKKQNDRLKDFQTAATIDIFNSVLKKMGVLN